MRIKVQFAASYVVHAARSSRSRKSLEIERFPQSIIMPMARNFGLIGAFDGYQGAALRAALSFFSPQARGAP
jgi:hypothetical protein